MNEGSTNVKSPPPLLPLLRNYNLNMVDISMININKIGNCVGRQYLNKVTKHTNVYVPGTCVFIIKSAERPNIT